MLVPLGIIVFLEGRARGNGRLGHIRNLIYRVVSALELGGIRAVLAE
jgi:hypothetical protein